MQTMQVLNTDVIDAVDEATSHVGISNYGKIVVGDQGFEFIHQTNPDRYIQIPWSEVDIAVASVMFKGRWIPRFGIQTRHNGIYAFSSRHPKDVLRAVQKYIGADRVRYSLTFFQVIRRGIHAWAERPAK
jgi:hypothetical protein